MVIKEMFLHSKLRKKILDESEGKMVLCKFTSVHVSLCLVLKISITILNFITRYLFMVFKFNYQAHPSLPFGLHILHIA